MNVELSLGFEGPRWPGFSARRPAPCMVWLTWEGKLRSAVPPLDNAWSTRVDALVLVDAYARHAAYNRPADSNFQATEFDTQSPHCYHHFPALFQQCIKTVLASPSTMRSMILKLTRDVRSLEKSSMKSSLHLDASRWFARTSAFHLPMCAFSLPRQRGRL